MTHPTYNLSTDYTALWDFINKGIRIAAWIKKPRYDNKDHEIYNIVEVKMDFNFEPAEYSIGSPGISYKGEFNALADFTACCEHFNLKYIYPV